MRSIRAASLRADRPPTPDARDESTMRLLAAVPGALRRLLDGAGGSSLRAAERRIRQRTGVPITASTLSLWMRGETSPSLALLIPFLEAFDLGFRDLDRALRETFREEGDESDAIATELAERLRADTALREEVRALLAETTSSGGDAAAPRELLELLRNSADGEPR